MSVGSLWAVTLDCDDAQQLADFWAAMLDGKITYTSEHFVAVELANGVTIGAYAVPDHAPPRNWPDDGPKQFHLDISVTDMDVAQQQAVELGATLAQRQPEPERWRVLLDPAGHPFCITAMSA